jgi:hypothetical protein
VRARGLVNPVPLLLAAMAASAVILVVLGAKLTFILDDWVYILYRRDLSADAFLLPANEHLVAGPVAVWKLILAGFGMSSPIPFRLVSTAIFMLGNWFLFVWIRRRLGGWPALLATVPVIFLGAAWEDLLWFSSISFLGGLTCGLGMLLALDRRDRSGDVLACAWLVGALLFSSLWAPFALGAAVDIALRHRERDWRRRAYVVLVPLALFGLWWLGWGHDAESSVSLANIAATPGYVADAFTAALAALLGLAIPTDGTNLPAWLRPLAVALAGLAIWRASRLERIPRALWVVLAAGMAFWILAGFAVREGRSPWESRYQLPGVVFVLLVATELLRGIRLDRSLLAVAALVVAAAVVGNVRYLHDAYESYLRSTKIIRADLAAVEIARGTVEPDFVIDEEFGDTAYVNVDAGSYLSAADEDGSPAYTIDELQAAPLEARAAADKVLINALRPSLKPVSPAAAGPSSLRCAKLPSDPDAPSLTMPPGGVTIRSRSRTSGSVELARFAADNGYPIELPIEIAPDQAIAIMIPTDLSSVPWRLRVEGTRGSTVCPLVP